MNIETKYTIGEELYYNHFGSISKGVVSSIRINKKGNSYSFLEGEVLGQSLYIKESDCYISKLDAIESL